MSLSRHTAAYVLLFTLFILVAMCGVAHRPPMPVPHFHMPDISASTSNLLLQAQKLEEEAQQFSHGLSALLMDVESRFSPEPLCVLPAQCIEVTP